MESYDAIGIEIVHQMRVTGALAGAAPCGEPWLEDRRSTTGSRWRSRRSRAGRCRFTTRCGSPAAAFVLVACAFLLGGARLRARRRPRHGRRRWRLLLLVGSVGLIVHAHEAIPDHAALHRPARRSPRSRTSPPALAAEPHRRALGLAFLASAIVVFPLALYVATLVTWARAASGARARIWARSRSAAAACADRCRLASCPACPRSELARACGDAYHGRDFSANLRYFLGILMLVGVAGWPLAAWALWSQSRQFGEPRVFALWLRSC